MKTNIYICLLDNTLGLGVFYVSFPGTCVNPPTTASQSHFLLHNMLCYMFSKENYLSTLTWECI